MKQSQIIEMIRNLEVAIKDIGQNQFKDSKDLQKIKTIILNQEKRLVWCEENIHTNMKPIKVKQDNRFFEQDKNNPNQYNVINPDCEDEYQDMFK